MINIKQALRQAGVPSQKKGRLLYVPAVQDGAAVISKGAIAGYCLTVQNPFTREECKALKLDPGFFLQVHTYFADLDNTVQAAALVARRAGK